MLRCVVGGVFLDVSKELSASRTHWLLKMKPICFFETSETTHTLSYPRTPNCWTSKCLIFDVFHNMMEQWAIHVWGTSACDTGKGKAHPRTVLEDPEGGAEVYLYSFFNLVARWVCLVNVTPRPLYPRERDPVSTVEEAGWAPGPVWTGAENFFFAGIRSPDRPSRSESLYRLRYSSPLSTW
jgi:hypothetical protein